MFRKGTIDDPQIVPVYNAASIADAEQAKILLEQEGIPALLMDREDSGEYLRILGYGSPFGVDVYVSADHAERAKELINEAFSDKEGMDEEELARLALDSASDEV